MQQVLKPASGAARAQVIAAELFRELDVAMDDALSTLDVGFRGVGLPPLTRDAESWGGFRDRDACAWHPPSVLQNGLSPRQFRNTGCTALEGVVTVRCDSRRSWLWILRCAIAHRSSALRAAPE